MENNKHCLAATLDENSTKAIEALQRSLGRTDEQSAHITIATYYDADENELLGWADTLTKCHHSFRISFYGIGIFLRCGIIALPTVTTKLTALYEAAHSRYDEYCNEYTSLEKDKWFPHTSLFYGDEANICEKIIRARNEFQVIDATVTGLRITRCLEDRFEAIFHKSFLD